MAKDLKLLSLNCRGLNNPNEMRKLFEWINDNKYDIICLQETFCTDKLKPVFDMCWNGISAHALTDSSHSRGVTIMFNDKVDLEIINVHASKDGRKVLTNVKIDQDVTLSIVSIYAPNIEKDRTAFFKTLSKWITQYSTNTDNVIVCGDFNCCLNDEDRLPKTHVNDKSRLAMQNMMKFCKMNDAWQIHCIDKTNRYTYVDKKNGTKSRLDYVLISEKCCVNHCDINLIKPIKGDHKGICIKLVYSETKRGPGYWKLNSSILKQGAYQEGVKEIVKTTNAQFENVKSKRLVWELIKINVKEYSIQYCKKNNKKTVKKEVELQKSINRLEEIIDSMSDANMQKNDLIHEKGVKELELNDLYDQKVKGAQIRSKAEWVEQGERSNKYFLGLEKQRQKNNVIKQLHVQGESEKIVSNDNDILVETAKFYDTLYKSVNIDECEINKYMDKC
jgi:exonuclease III